MTLAQQNLGVYAGAPPLLVGRERECALLRDGLDAALTGHGSFILLTGSAGFGKTALATELIRDAATQGVSVLVGRCYDRTDTPPYGLWTDLFAHFADVGRAAGAACPEPAVPPALAERHAVGPVPSQAALAHQVLDFLRALAALHPVVVVLDDLQWSDPASLDLLRALARNISALSVLIIAAYRSDELPREHHLNLIVPLLTRETGATHITLQPLTERDLNMFVAQRYELHGSDAAALVRYLHARTEGNPFFMITLLQMLEDEGLLRHGAHGWTVGDLREARIPLLLRQVIDALLLPLGSEAERLLAVAAIIGEDVPLDLWRTVTGTDEGELLDVIERAVAARVLAEDTSGIRVRFVHALIREALLDRVLAARRRSWHRHVAEALLREPRPNPHVVAYHFTQAGDARAAAWLQQAGGEALRSFAWVTAAERFRAAVTAMDAAGETDSAARGWLLYDLALALHFANPRAAITYLDEALRIAHRAGDHALHAGATFQRGSNRYLLGEIDRALTEAIAGADFLDSLAPSERPQLDRFPMSTILGCHGILIHYLAWAGLATDAVRRGERCLRDTGNEEGASGNNVALGLAHGGLGIAYATLGRIAEADAAFARSSAAYKQQVDADLGLGFTALYALITLILPYQTTDITERETTATAGEDAWRRDGGIGYNASPRAVRLPLLVVEGNWAEARTEAETLWARPLPATRQLGASVLGPLARAQGDIARGRELVRTILPEGPETAPGTLPFIYTPILLRLGAGLALDAGDGTTARAWLTAHDRWLAWNGAILGRADGHLGWATYYRAVGDRSAAEQEATEALHGATEPRQPLALLAAHRLLGELAIEAGQFDLAALHLDEAVILADACAAPYERALTLLAQAELRLATGAKAEARALLDTARAICVTLGAQPALARADALAARLAARSAVHHTGLTQREIEVLRLLAAGKSNREIGHTLSMSVRTAERHINNIYFKINARGRVEATAFALRHGIAEHPST